MENIAHNWYPKKSQLLNVSITHIKCTYLFNMKISYVILLIL